jgi:hypothetical protein
MKGPKGTGWRHATSIDYALAKSAGVCDRPRGYDVMGEWVMLSCLGR